MMNYCSKSLLLSALLLTPLLNLLAKPILPDESKITITSNKASCQQNQQHKKQFTFTYLDNVTVDFSDGTHAASDKLVVDIDTTKPEVSPTTNKTQQIKTITMSNHVLFTQKERKARADQAVFYPEKKQCILSGNVRITQKPVDEKGIPMNINCSKAAIDMTSGNIRLLGTDAKPVSTTLVLNKKSSILQQPLVTAHAKHPIPVASRSA